MVQEVSTQEEEKFSKNSTQTTKQPHEWVICEGAGTIIEIF